MMIIILMMTIIMITITNKQRTLFHKILQFSPLDVVGKIANKDASVLRALVGGGGHCYGMGSSLESTKVEE